MLKINKILFLLLIFWGNVISTKKIDLTLLAGINSADGFGKIAGIIAENLSNKINLKILLLGLNNDDISNKLLGIIRSNLFDKNKDETNILLAINPLWTVTGWDITSHIPDAKIKIAYLMTETDTIPNEWVFILNKIFDAVAVPNDHSLNVFEKQGVKIPLFILPCPIILREQKIKKNQLNNVFNFGMTANILPHKNHSMLVNAFALEFGNNPNVQLFIHSRVQDELHYPKIYVDAINNCIKETSCSNIFFKHKTFMYQEYVDFLGSLACYVLLSKGEGFSYTPYEAMALEIPCILTNNTSHKILCDSGFIYSVNAYIKEKADFYKKIFGEKYTGYFLNCTVDDVRKAMRDVYDNYQFYKEQSKKAKEWVFQFDFENFQEKYLSLVKPKKIILGKENKIENNYIMTSSKALYEKYLSI